MELQQFMDRLLAAAKEAGIEAAEIYYGEKSSFDAKAQGGVIDSYEVSDTRSLSLRGTVGGKMGYASTEAFDDEAIPYLVHAVIDSAALNNAEDQDEIFAGDEAYPTLAEEENDLDEWTAEKKLALALEIEKAALNADSRVQQTEGALISTPSSRVVLRNTYGLNLSREEKMFISYVMPIAKDGDATASNYELAYGRRLSELDPVALGEKATELTVAQLHAEPVSSGEYRVIMHRDAMRSLLAVFSSIFSAENAQQNMSLLAGREGQEIASGLVTILDDPLLPGGLASTTFDDEGSAAMTKAVVEHGVLKTLLHNRRTAKKQGVRTTGNARRGNGLHVAPTNFFIQPGEKSLSDLLTDLGDGLLITEVSGLHAGANPISGDFSLLSKGFVVRGGQQAEPVERVTVAGNFYELLKAIRAVGSDLAFQGSSIGAPSVDVGVLTVSGK